MIQRVHVPIFKKTLQKTFFWFRKSIALTYTKKIMFFNGPLFAITLELKDNKSRKLALNYGYFFDLRAWRN